MDSDSNSPGLDRETKNIPFSNEIKREEIIEPTKRNRFLSFITSKAGIITIIIIIVVIVVSVTLPIILTKKNNNNKKDDNEEKYVDENKLSSISLYVKKIENIPKNFIFGMDISSLISEEESGVKYYNFKDEEKDLLEIIKNVGINYIRIRIWNDPYDSEGHGYGGGNCDMEKAIKIGKRATMYGMKVMASFHFSDFYADPKLQKVPKAWANLTFEQKAIKAKEFIIESINRFKEEGINLGIATLGNEITNGFCGETDWTKIVEILNPCSKAAREIFPDILIAVHFTNPEKEGFQKWLAQELNNNNLDYDIFSTSY